MEKKLAPLLGQNSYEILQEMGMKDVKIKN